MDINDLLKILLEESKIKVFLGVLIFIFSLTIYSNFYKNDLMRLTEINRSNTIEMIFQMFIIGAIPTFLIILILTSGLYLLYYLVTKHPEDRWRPTQ
ncbi:MAG: hypothetical protein KO464_01615 [Candidatus Methanofastidiosum sp.]|nr:hypothetical protein [Methanofastidiosum sp.]